METEFSTFMAENPSRYQRRLRTVLLLIIMYMMTVMSHIVIQRESQILISRPVNEIPTMDPQILSLAILMN